ncbi:MAG: tetratricopeptide repeat protein [Bdellovibrionota bacterium]
MTTGKRLYILLALASSLAACSLQSRKPEPSTSEGMAKQAGADIDEMVAEDGGESSGGNSSSGQIAPPTGESVTGEAKYQALSQALRAGRGRAIVEEAAKILGTNSTDPVALNALALDHLRQGRTGAARLLLVRALEKNPTNPSLLNNMAVIDLQENEQGAAIAGFKKALKEDDSHPQASANLGSIYVRGGDFARAVSLLESPYRSGKLNAAAINAYAVALRANGDLDRAKRIYEDLIKRDARDVAAHLNLAVLLIDFMNKPKDGLALVYKVKFLETDRRDVQAKANALEKKAKAALQ